MSFKDKLYNQDVKEYEGKIYLSCCVGVEYDLDLLEYSINYYKDLGVDEFFYILNTTDPDSSNLKEGIKILDKYPKIHKKVWIGEFFALWKNKRKKDFIKDYIMGDDWVIIIDVDEFYDFPMGLRELITICEAKGYYSVLGRCVDRLAEDGRLKPIDKKKSLWEQFPINTEITKKYYFDYRKIVLSRNYADLSIGHHYLKSGLEKKLIYPEVLKVYHFHWIEGLIKKIEARLAIWEKISSRDCSNHLLLLSHYDKYGTLL